MGRRARVPRPRPGVGRRSAALAALIGVTSLVPEGHRIALQAISDAYITVSVFVAGTLAVVFAVERAFKSDLASWLVRYRRWQVPAAALLGALPGCGGAIVAVTQYTRGYLSFGGVVAALTATMGDAMFLLLAQEPSTAALALALSIAIGIGSGYAVDAFHGQGFMRLVAGAARDPVHRPSWLPPRWSAAEVVWVALIVPGLVAGVLSACQVDVDAVLASPVGLPPVFALGALGGGLALVMWARNGGDLVGVHRDDTRRSRSVVRSVIDDTNFVATWVVFAFVGYELAVSALGIDLGEALSVWGPLVPAVAIVVGFVPGCGPQIVVTSLYLSGVVPLSAQLGNAIANDGDALFPAIAVAPRAAIAATLYSAIPAAMIGYGWYWLVE